MQVGLPYFFCFQVKAAEKRSAQFLKQVEKSETKQQKRELQLEKIADLEKQIADQLLEVRSYSASKELFLEKYLTGSKFGTSCGKKNVWIVCEASEKTANYVTNMIDEVSKLVSGPETENCERYRMH